MLVVIAVLFAGNAKGQSKTVNDHDAETGKVVWSVQTTDAKADYSHCTISLRGAAKGEQAPSAFRLRSVPSK